jgi:hypothetical protein
MLDTNPLAPAKMSKMQNSDLRSEAIGLMKRAVPSA